MDGIHTGGETLQTFEVWDEGRWSYQPCREHIKLVVYFARHLDIYVNGRHLSPADYDLLMNGEALPATVLRRNPSHISWHPDDYVIPESAVAKETKEWARIVATPEYSQTFRYFKKLMQREGVKP